MSVTYIKSLRYGSLITLCEFGLREKHSMITNIALITIYRAIYSICCHETTSFYISTSM